MYTYIIIYTANHDAKVGISGNWPAGSSILAAADTWPLVDLMPQGRTVPVMAFQHDDRAGDVAAERSESAARPFPVAGAGLHKPA